MKTQNIKINLKYNYYNKKMLFINYKERKKNQNRVLQINKFFKKQFYNQLKKDLKIN